MLNRARGRTLTEERGAVLVLMAAAMPVMILLLAMVMDFGNWYIRTSQLQTRVDAAALAAGLEYTTRFRDCGTNAHNPNGAIIGIATEYAGPRNGGSNGDLQVAVNAADDPSGWRQANGTAGAPCLSPYETKVEAIDHVTSFFSGFGVINPTFYASATVGLMKAETASGMKPLALVDPTAPVCVHARFGGADEILLERVGVSTQYTGRAETDMPSNDLPVSVRIGCGSSSHTYDAMAYVTRVGSPTRLDNLRLVSAGATPCPNPYFLPRNGYATCTVRVEASTEFAVPDNPRVRVTVAGNTTTLTQSGNVWSGEISLARRSGGAAGALPVVVEARNGPGDPDTGFSEIGRAVVQAGKAGDQGRIVNVVLPDYARNDGASLGNPSITVTLRDNVVEVIDGGVDCAPGNAPDLQQTFVNGCSGPFRVNTNPSGCDSNAASGGTAPFDCVGGIDPSDPPGAPNSLDSLRGDYNALWAPNGCGGGKDKNNWASAIEPGDPRLITLFLTDTIPPTQNPGQVYPITGFGGFYVTGWDGAPPACGSSGTNGENDPAPPVADNGSVWGHYVKLVLPSADGTPSATPCDQTAAACIAVLVR